VVDLFQLALYKHFAPNGAKLPVRTGFRISWPSPRGLKVSTDEAIYQIGICPNCPSRAEQRFLFATESHYGPIVEQGRIVGYEQIETLSLFRCERCEGHLLYLTTCDPPGGVGIDFVPGSPNEVAELDTNTFLEISSLEWPGISVNSLSPLVPKRVRDIYDEALSVKSVSPNSFAVQVGRALEAIQKDLGIPKRGLESLEISPEGLSQLAIKIKNWRNVAAHSDDSDVTAEQVEEIDSFFRLITDYVYVLPDKLGKARKKLELTADLRAEGIIH